MRGSLLSLQGNAKSIDRTQERLSTGRKVNSALDNPTNFFASQAALNRAGDLLSRKDSVKEAIQNIHAANNGITAISSLLSAANGLAEAALGTNVQDDRDSFSKQFDEILNQIDTLATDSGYRGTNLLKSDSLTVNFSESGGSSTLSVAGVDATSTGLSISMAAAGSASTTVTSGYPVGTIVDTFTASSTMESTPGFGVTVMVPHSLGALNPPGYTIDVTVNGAALTRAFGSNVPQPAGYWFSSTSQKISLPPLTTGDVVVIASSPGVVSTGATLDAAAPWTTTIGTGVTTTTTPGSGNLWDSTSGIQSSQDQINAAITTMRSNAKNLASNSTILTTRLDYISSMANILQTGSDNLTLADMNEEGANMLMLQTR
jgi:flagellin